MPAPALRELQRGFWTSLHGGAPDSSLLALVPPGPQLAPAARLAIYADMYVWRLVGLLREDYPKLAEALGDDFDELTRRYLARHPSRHPSVRHLGRELPPFLRDDPIARARPWLADLAHLELARVDAFDAPDAALVSVADLRTVAPEAWAELRFAVVPALEVFRCTWPAHDVWATPALDVVAPRPTTLRVWRQAYRVFHATIDRLEEDALAAVMADRPFAAVCEVVAEHVGVDEAPAHAGALLARWIDDGLVAALRA